MSILNVNKINPVGSGSTVTIAGIASVTSSVIASSFVGNPLLLQTSGSERLRITSAGRIGIGTETPDSILAIEGTGSDNNTRVTIKDGTGIAEVNGRYGNLILDSDRDNAVSGSVMTFQVDGSERLRINASGKIVAGNSGLSFGNAAIQAFIQHGNTAGESGFSSVDTTSVAAGVGGEIAFHGKYNTGAQDYAYTGHIRGIKENATAGNTACALTFHTRPNAVAPQERMRISSEGYVTKPQNPVFHAFGGPSNVAVNNDIVFGQERFDIGGGYNTSNGIYTAPVTGYYHFYAQVYRQATENDAWWGFYFNGSQVSEARLQNNYGSDSGRGYATLQSSIYWYMTAGETMKCRVGSAGAIHCNNTLSYFCGNLVG